MDVLQRLLPVDVESGKASRELRMMKTADGGVVDHPLVQLPLH